MIPSFERGVCLPSILLGQTNKMADETHIITEKYLFDAIFSSRYSDNNDLKIKLFLWIISHCVVILRNDGTTIWQKKSYDLNPFSNRNFFFRVLPERDWNIATKASLRFLLNRSSILEQKKKRKRKKAHNGTGIGLEGRENRSRSHHGKT